MFQPERLLGAILSEALSSSLGGGVRHGRRRPRAFSSPAVGMGLLGLAIGAFEHFSGQQSGTNTTASAGVAAPPPPPRAVSMPPPPPSERSELSPALIALYAMFSAAGADGSVDENEKKRIQERLRSAGLGEEERGFFEREISAPRPLSEILELASQAKLNAEMKEQIFLAALLAVERDTEAEHLYFRDLAQGLGLSPTQIRALEASIREQEEL